MLELTIAHPSHSQLCSHLSTPHYKGKEVDWGSSLLLIEHIFICLLISKAGFLCKHKYKDGGGKS
jgi:hypothetical protein